MAPMPVQSFALEGRQLTPLRPVEGSRSWASRVVRHQRTPGRGIKTEMAERGKSPPRRGLTVREHGPLPTSPRYGDLPRRRHGHKPRSFGEIGVSAETTGGQKVIAKAATASRPPELATPSDATDRDLSCGISPRWYPTGSWIRNHPAEPCNPLQKGAQSKLGSQD